jgi:hypothetical protein
MTLGNMRKQGVQRLIAFCLNDSCRHQAIIDVSKYPAPRSRGSEPRSNAPNAALAATWPVAAWVGVTGARYATRSAARGTENVSPSGRYPPLAASCYFAFLERPTERLEASESQRTIEFDRTLFRTLRRTRVRTAGKCPRAGARTRTYTRECPP